MDARVEYNFLGKSGLKVSNIGLGTMTFGTVNSAFPGLTSQASEERSHQIMDKYAEFGGNFIDTADVYQLGQSETIVGNWLQKNGRDKMVVATKVWPSLGGSDVNGVGLSRRHITVACEESLRRLQTDYIDLYQIHTWDSATPIEETLRTFDDLIRCGKVRYFGCSNVVGWQLQKIVDKLEYMGLNRCISLQQQYNLLTRQSEFEEFMVCRNEAIGVLTWSPLKGGMLTGKYQRGSTVGGTDNRIGFMQTLGRFYSSSPDWNLYANNEDYWKLMAALSTIAAKHGKTVPQVAIRWLLQKDIVASVLVGTTSVKQLEDNIGAAKGWQISDEDMSKLDETGFQTNQYPYEMVYRMNADRINPFNK